MKVVSKWARGLIAALAGVGVLGAASCDALQDTPESPPPHERPPQFRQVTANLTCAFPIVPERELFIRDLGVVNDPARTQWSGILPTGSGIADGAWSFGRLMAQMSGPVAPEDFVRNWLAQWETGQTVNGQLISARSSITPQIINAWPKRPNGKLDLTKSPMRLLAIVNRVDVRDLSLGSAGEGRFVYGVLDAGGNPLQFTVILEYDLPAKTRMDVLDWANRWHALGAQTPGSAAFNTALQAITDRFTAGNAAPGRPNGSALNQLRTNEIALASPWQLREFHLDAATGLLKSDTVALTPGRSLRTSNSLAAFINDNPPMIIPGPPKWNQNSFYFVRGTPTVSWSIVQSGSGVSVARIFQDSVLLTSLAGSGGINYFIHWDTSVLSDGRHTISLEATDRAGNVSSHSRFVDVDNTPPAYLAITAPYNGAQVSGVVTLSATGSDNMDLASIAFQVDGTTLTPFATTAPYTRTWNSTGLSGTHTIVAIAYDRAGNSARSAPVTVTVP